MSVGPIQSPFPQAEVVRKVYLGDSFGSFLTMIRKEKLYEDLLKALKGEILYDKGWREILERLYIDEHEFFQNAFLINIPFEDTPDFYIDILHEKMGPYTLWHTACTFAKLGFRDLSETLLKETGNLGKIEDLPGKISHRYAPKPPSEKE